jgi:hypothetical protein
MSATGSTLTCVPAVRKDSGMFVYPRPGGSPQTLVQRPGRLQGPVPIGTPHGKEAGFG